MKKPLRVKDMTETELAALRARSEARVVAEAEDRVMKRLARRRGYSNKYRAQDPANAKQINKRSYQKHKHKRQAYRTAKKETYTNYHLKSTYGITTAERDALLAGQGGKCAGCGTIEPMGYGWHVDHCHTSGCVRGILCSLCNTGMGSARDSVETLQSWIDYLNRFKTE